MPSESAAGAVCPVDHKSREAWLQHSRNTVSGAGPPSPPPTTGPLPSTCTPTSLPAPRASLPASCDSTSMSAARASSPSALPTSLGTTRQVSSIPRSFGIGGSSSSSSTSSFAPPVAGAPAAAPNAESASDPHTSATGHWVYPSEAQFFAAMARKRHSPRAADMQTIIPIHNAVNERAWAEILAWERGRGDGGAACGGPRLVSFAGDAAKLSPRARAYGWLGYAAPFDRHDWVVDRCGTRVEYVIDFYQGKGAANAGGLSFYLDVRPKLNTLEGCWMRVARFVGW